MIVLELPGQLLLVVGGVGKSHLARHDLDHAALGPAKDEVAQANDAEQTLLGIDHVKVGHVVDAFLLRPRPQHGADFVDGHVLAQRDETVGHDAARRVVGIFQERPDGVGRLSRESRHRFASSARRHVREHIGRIGRRQAMEQPGQLCGSKGVE